jgi:hypothetical protein
MENAVALLLTLSTRINLFGFAAVSVCLVTPLSLSHAVAADISLCAVAAHSEQFDHSKVDLQGLAADVSETKSRRGNDYTTFKLIDPSGCGAIKIFVWEHPKLATGDRVCVEGIFEKEHHERQYTFYNEVQATSITECAAK